MIIQLVNVKHAVSNKTGKSMDIDLDSRTQWRILDMDWIVGSNRPNKTS